MFLIITAPSGFEKQARKEVGEILSQLDSKASVSYTYFKGLLLAECKCDVPKVIDLMRATETRYVNRVIPLGAECKGMPEAVAFFENVDIAGKKFAVRCERRGAHTFSGRDVEVEIGALLKKKGGIVDLDEPDVFALVELIQERLFVGFASKEHVLQKRSAVERKWAKGDRPVSRAELKMREVMKRFPELFKDGFSAIDLGAAPGGWSRAMSGRARKVWAVDSAELDSDVLSLGNVVHINTRGENVALEEEVDILTNDANITPTESACLSVTVARKYLRSGGYLVHTVKLFSDPNARGGVAKSLNHAAQEVIREFQDNGFEILSKAKMKYNTRNETTIVAKYRSNEE